MLPEEEMGLAGQQMDIHSSAVQNALVSAQTQSYIEEKEKTTMEAQLDVQRTLLEVYHLLKQDVLKPSKENNGMLDWFPLENISDRVLTDLGVDKIMQVVKSYVNKETLLSNFSENQIKTRMLLFAKALNGNIFMKYEVYFREPSIEECKKILKDKLKEKMDLKKFTYEVIGKEFNKEEIERSILGEVEDRVEYEIDKIRKEKIKQNLREYELLFTQICALVDATHNRAWRGEERGSLRRHMNVSEVIGAGPKIPIKKSGGAFGWNMQR